MSVAKSNRAANFYAGPSILPVPVLEKLSASFADHYGAGMSMVETSHRSSMYDEIHFAAIKGLKKLLGIPHGYRVLFLGGGATLQFSMVPMNLIPVGGSCDYVNSGSWAGKAISDAEKLGTVNIVFDGKDSGFTTLPRSLETTRDASYVHITSNETINGVQWNDIPVSDDVPLVADMSSDIMSRRFEISRLGLFYAAAQKNLGPAGVTIVVIRDDLIEPVRPDLTAYLSYRTHAEKESLYNTPPVFSIYALKLVLDWIEASGGLEAMERNANKKSSLIYRAIDESDGFFRNGVDPTSRSKMNVVFTLGTDKLQDAFLSETEAHRMVGLKGHRSVGGIRASLYNAMPFETVEALADLMREFARKNG